MRCWPHPDGCWSSCPFCPQVGLVFMIKRPCGWSRFALRTRAGTSAKCSCWTSSMTPFIMAAGSISPSTVSMGLLPGDGGATWKAHYLRACFRGSLFTNCTPFLLQRGASVRLGPAPPELSPQSMLGSCSSWEEQLPGHEVGVFCGW